MTVLVSLSATHKNTPFETLENLAAIGGGIGGDLATAHESIRGVVVVATCNRFEAYLDLSDRDGGASVVPAVSAAIEHLASLTESSPNAFRELLELAHGDAVVLHLFSVAAGLESVALGEDEIAGQVKRSIESSRREGTVSSDLERLFQRASEASREVRNSSSVSLAGRSIVRLALQLASTRVANWTTSRVLLVGTGRYAAASLAAMRDLGARDVRIYSMSGRGGRFASSHNLPLIGRDEYEAEVEMADVIVTCTTTAGFALDAATIGRARAAANPVDAQTHRQQVLIDLGLPRNIDPGVAALAGIELLDLETIRVHAPIDELSTLTHAHETVRAAANRFATNSRSQDVSPTVVAVRGYVRGIVEEEVSRLHTLGKLDAQGERALRHLGGILMHRLTVRGQFLAASGESQRWVDGVESVLGIPAEAAALELANRTRRA